jgi:hypothetical protein
MASRRHRIALFTGSVPTREPKQQQKRGKLGNLNAGNF